MRPLHRDVFAAEERVVEETRQIAGNDEGDHEQQDFPHRSVAVNIEEGPVESQHAELGQAQSEVVEIVRGERDLAVASVSEVPEESSGQSGMTWTIRGE